MPSLAGYLSTAFSRATRDRGLAYFEDGRVHITRRTDDEIGASVRGGDRYDVRLLVNLDDDERWQIGVGCTCPYALDGEPCKHAWATILAAEAGGWPPDLNDAPPRAIDLQILNPTPGLVADDEEEDAGMEAWAGLPAGEFARTETAFSPAVRRRPPREVPTPATMFLEHFESELASHEVRAQQPPAFAGDLLYAIDVTTSRLNVGPVLQVLWRQARASGGFNKPKLARLTMGSARQAGAMDRPVVAALMGAGHASGGAAWFHDPMYGGTASSFLLPDTLALELLPPLARRGALYLRDEGVSPGGITPLAWDDGPAWRFAADVSASPSGAREAFVVSGTFVRGDERVAVGDPKLVITAGFLVLADRIARLDLAGDPSLVMTLRAVGPAEVPGRHGARLAYALARAGVAGAALPPALQVQDVDVTPEPRLTLTPAQWAGPGQFDATPTFDYDGSVVPNDAARVTYDEARRRVVRRHADEEKARNDELVAAGLRWGNTYAGPLAPFRLTARAALPAIHRLLGQGWRVEGQGQAYRRAGGVRLSVRSGVDWFDLEASVEFGDQSLPLADLLAALRRKEPVVRLGDGSVGLVPEEWLRRYAPLAAAATEVEDKRLRFGRAQGALLDALLDARRGEASVSVDEGFEAMRREIAAFTSIAPAEAPAGFAGTLRDYQRQGLGWFLFLRRFGFGGCLADDMGLGKTIMVLALLAWWRDARVSDPSAPRPSLIVVPRSLVQNWMNEAAKFTPHLSVLDYSGTGRAASAEVIADHDIVLTTYGTVRRDAPRLADVPFEYVILDEAQAIKNAGTVSAKAVRLLRGRYRLALSGTPIENHLGELWSLFEFLNPGLLGRASVFQRAATTSGSDPETLAIAARGLRPFILRRTKAQVARELPARTEQTIACELSTPERAFYDGLRQHYRDALLERVARVGMARSKIQILEALLRLRQAACHPGLVDAKRRADPSAKFDVLVPRLRELADEGHKALVFSQFTTLLGLLQPRLDDEGLTYEYLDGRTRDRQARVDRFQQDPDCRLFLISLKAGGVGLNLTAAEYVFLLDPWWNPAVEAQAIDRTHRIGQTREVFAYRVIASDTVEGKVLSLQQSKRALADAVLTADGNGLKDLDKEDLEILLS
jgi:superfamily II DNA or RNA helicase